MEPQDSIYILGRILALEGLYLETIGTPSVRRERERERERASESERESEPQRTLISYVSGLVIRASEFDIQIYLTRGKSPILLESLFTLEMINILSIKGNDRYGKAPGSN